MNKRRSWGIATLTLTMNIFFFFWYRDWRSPVSLFCWFSPFYWFSLLCWFSPFYWFFFSWGMDYVFYCFFWFLSYGRRVCVVLKMMYFEISTMIILTLALASLILTSLLDFHCFMIRKSPWGIATLTLTMSIFFSVDFLLCWLSLVFLFSFFFFIFVPFDDVYCVSFLFSLGFSMDYFCFWIVSLLILSFLVDICTVFSLDIEIYTSLCFVFWISLMSLVFLSFLCEFVIFLVFDQLYPYVRFRFSFGLPFFYQCFSLSLCCILIHFIASWIFLWSVRVW